MRRLILLRHAKSSWPDDIWDHERPLAPRGIEAMALVGRYLTEEKLIPDRVVVSTAKRTRETFELLSAPFKPPHTQLVSEPRIYEAAVSALVEVVRETPESCKTLMMIGHNPGIAELSYFLVRPAVSSKRDLERLTTKFPTASIAVLEFEANDWDVMPRTAHLERFITPKQIGGVDED